MKLPVTGVVGPVISTETWCFRIHEEGVFEQEGPLSKVEPVTRVLRPLGLVSSVLVEEGTYTVSLHKEEEKTPTTHDGGPVVPYTGDAPVDTGERDGSVVPGV